MLPSYTMRFIALFYLPVCTVASAPESVFALEGNSVILTMKRNDSLDPDVVIWKLDQSADIVRYYPQNSASRQGGVLATYNGKAEFNNTTFSLELKRLMKNDSGLYTGEINDKGKRATVQYRLSIYGEFQFPCRIKNEWYIPLH